MNEQSEIIGWTTLITTLLLTAGKLISVLTRGGLIRTADAKDAQMAAHWKRLEDLNDDLRADNDRLRKLLEERDSTVSKCYIEIQRLRTENEDLWRTIGRRRTRGDPGQG